eukprot:CAMPEP_0184483856 /NCGR_PEP_ID=MMETSP0113_2-20130426/5526_1 /TAXON_ID=91329 /ORGANISM="Norrisiella sphaerica, Strain BC52" /LENGTH=744 /DNA_ID=CAMNT_0026864497 /DNA_START=118 /DNA_END=2352 /DNA_ORIENTATION=+
MMHLRMLQMVTEALNQQMVSRVNRADFAEGLISHVQNLLWFASLSISDLRENMIDYIRRRHASAARLSQSGPENEESESVYGLDAKEAMLEVEYLSRKSQSREIPVKPELPLRPSTKAVSYQPPRPTPDRSRKGKSRGEMSAPKISGNRNRSAVSFDNSMLPLGMASDNNWNFDGSLQSSNRRKRDGHRRMSMGGGGGQNEMGSFQVKFLLKFKQVRNQDKSGVQRQELLGLVSRHCQWIITSGDLPFRKIMSRFISDMRARGSIGTRKASWGKAKSRKDQEQDFQVVKTRTLREQLLQVSEFVSTLASTIWRMHETLQSRRDPTPLRELFIPQCIKAIWPVVLNDLEPIIFEWYKDVYKQTSTELLNYWEGVRRDTEMSSPAIKAKTKILQTRLSSLTTILKDKKFIGFSLQGKIESLLSIVRNVPSVVPKDREASADSLLSILSYCIFAAGVPQVCAHVHYLADMVMLVYPEDAFGELGCTVTSLVCAAQYGAGLEVPSYMELVECLVEETGGLTTSTAGHETPDKTIRLKKAAASEGIGLVKKKKLPAAPPMPKRTNSWQTQGGDISDLIAVCQHAAKHAGRRSKSQRPLFVASELVRHLYGSRICNSRQDAVRLGQTLEAYGIIRPFIANKESSSALGSDSSLSYNSSSSSVRKVGIYWGKHNPGKDDLKSRAGGKLSNHKLRIKNLKFGTNDSQWEVAGKFGDAGQKMRSAFQYSVQNLSAMWNKRKTIDGAVPLPKTK